MKKDNILVQSGIVVFSLLLSVATVFFTTQLITESGQTNTMNTEIQGIPEIEKIAAPISYETRIKKGDQLFNSGYYTLAATEFSFAIDIQPENPTAYARLGETNFKMGENQKALEAFERAIEYSDKSDYKVSYAIAHIRIKDFESANVILRELANDQKAYFYRTLLEAYKNNYTEAQNMLKLAFETKGDVPETWLQNIQSAFNDYNAQIEGQDTYLNALLSQAMIDAGEYQLAEEFAKSILNVKPDYRDVWILLGYSQLKTKQYQEAEDAFKEAINLDPLKPETHYFLGNSHFLQNEYDPAVKEFELALLHGFEPKLEAYKYIAECYNFLEQYEDALASYEYLIKINPESIQDFMKAIQISTEQLQDLDRALSLAKEGVSEFPTDAISHNLLGWVYLERGELELAQKSIEKALSLDPKLPEIHYNLGLLEEQKGNGESAKNAYKAAHELAPAGSPISISAAEKYNDLSINTVETE